VRNRPGSFGALIRGLVPAAVAPALIGAAAQPADVSARVTGLRSAKGQVLACLTARATAFPDCAKDPAARAVSVPASAVVEIDFGEVPPGRYAISLFHDENGNGRLDRRLLIPREGYGFSRDAPVHFGPPRFAEAAFAVDGGRQRQLIRMRYMF